MAHLESVKRCVKTYWRELRAHRTLYGRYDYWKSWFTAKRDYMHAYEQGCVGRMEWIHKYNWTPQLASTRNFADDCIVAEANHIVKWAE